MINLGISEFFEDIKKIFMTKSVLGIDIGTVTMKLVEASRKGEAISFDNYGILHTREYLNRGNAAIQTSSLKISERDTIPLLKQLIAEVKPKSKNVIASIPIFSAFFVTIELPSLSVSETEQALKFQAKQYIPIPIAEVTIDWTKIGEYQNERGQMIQRFFLVAIPNEVITRYKTIFQSAGLHLIALEVEHQALLRACTTPNDSCVQIIDIGGESTTTIIIEKGVAKKVHQVDHGGVSLTRSLARTLDITPVRAEELKRRKGLLGSGGEYELSTSLLPFLDVIIQECSRVKADFEKTSHIVVDEVILVGGGANLLGIESYFKDQMRVKVRQPEPSHYFIKDQNLDPVMKSLNRELAIALGLALRYYL
ncbi:MAG: type IV pilus assembly protein PilM [Candidatus Paceibacterota bacterium]|jgi:type IV pilus assembly protein PilM